MFLLYFSLAHFLGFRTDRQRVNEAVQWALNPLSEGYYNIQFRTIGASDNQLRWLHCQGRALFDDQGSPYRFSGIAQDVTQQILAQQQADHAQQQIIQAIGRLPTGVAIAVFEGEDLIVRSVNPYYCQLVQRQPDQLLNKPLRIARPEVEQQGVIDWLKSVMASGNDLTGAEIPGKILTLGGSLQQVYNNFVYTPYYRLDGSVQGVVAVLVEVTTQVEARQSVEHQQEQYYQLAQSLEQQVQARTLELTRTNQALTEANEETMLINTQLEQANQDLTRSNANLQQFAYVASHDLQEPLRKIQSFSNLISQQLTDQADESIQIYLERISTAGARMSTLIKDLLTYSRIATRQQAFGAVSLSGIIQGVLAVLDWEIQQRQAQILVDELPSINGDQNQLSQLFQNLLTNALKFVPPGQSPQIHIQYLRRSFGELPPNVRPTKQASFYHQVSVSDNGVGFDVKYLDRIFQVFQRLHGKNEFPGTGIGLAIVQRVVENHGGSITASSQPGKGATFYLYLPA